MMNVEDHALKPKKRAFFVLSLENSGTRMTVQALCHSGCWGNPNNGELWNEPDPTFEAIPGDPPLIAFPRSVLHGGVMPDPFVYAQRMLNVGFKVFPVHVYRKTEFAIAGHLNGKYASSHQEAKDRIDLTARLIHELGATLRQPVMTVIYEQFVANKPYRDALFAQFGLPPTTYPMFNANEKYVLSAPPLPY